MSTIDATGYRWMPPAETADAPAAAAPVIDSRSGREAGRLAALAIVSVAGIGAAAGAIALLGRSRAAALAAGLGETGVDDAARGTLLLRRSTPLAELEELERILRDGRIIHTPLIDSDLGLFTGSTGSLERAVISDAADGTRTVEAVLKRSTQAQEEFGYLVARELGIDYLVPRLARRTDGSIAMEFIDGMRADAAGVTDAASLRAAIERHYRNMLGLSADDASRAARTDHELLAFFDWFTANRDRKATNVLVAHRDGSVKLIDHGQALRGELDDPLVPRLKHTYYPVRPGDSERIRLSPATREHIKSRLTDDVITRLHATFVDEAQLPGNPWDDAVLRRAQSQAQLDRLLLRRDLAVGSGVLEFAPVTPVSRNIEGADFLRQIEHGTFDTWGQPPRNPATGGVELLEATR